MAPVTTSFLLLLVRHLLLLAWHLLLLANIVTTSKAPVTTSVAPVTTSFQVLRIGSFLQTGEKTNLVALGTVGGVWTQVLWEALPTALDLGELWWLLSQRTRFPDCPSLF